jgi:hypothetical protein
MNPTWRAEPDASVAQPVGLHSAGDIEVAPVVIYMLQAARWIGAVDISVLPSTSALNPLALRLHRSWMGHDAGDVPCWIESCCWETPV